MNTVNQKIIDAVIKRAEALCPDSLALIGLYGSAATDDLHPKSDLDLLILINDDNWAKLADAFILNDTDIGYDIYCTSWEMLESDAACSHAHLSKLLDSPIVYVKDPSAVHRLDELRKKATAVLDSDARIEKALAAFAAAKGMYAECFLAESLSQVREKSGATIYYALDSVMLFHGQYFRKGVKRTFEELSALSLPFDIESLIMAVIRAETVDDIRTAATAFMRAVSSHLSAPAEKAVPCPENIAGTYEEMYSNWRNKMHEAAANGDVFSSFMNILSFTAMLNEIAAAVDVDIPDVLGSFSPHDLGKNAELFDDALVKYLSAYRKAGISPRRFADINKYLADYLNSTEK